MTLAEARQLLDAVRAGHQQPTLESRAPGAADDRGHSRRVVEPGAAQGARGGAVGEGCGVKPQNAPGAHEAADGYHPITEWSIVQPRPGKRPSRAIAGCEAA